jgi:hypothetical protein
MWKSVQHFFVFYDHQCVTMVLVAAVLDKMNGKILVENMNKIPSEQGRRVEVIFPLYF